MQVFRTVINKTLQILTFGYGLTLVLPPLPIAQVMQDVPFLPIPRVPTPLALAIRYVALGYQSVERGVRYVKLFLYLLCAHHRVEHVREDVLTQLVNILVTHATGRYLLALLLLLPCFHAALVERFEYQGQGVIVEHLFHIKRIIVIFSQKWPL